MQFEELIGSADEPKSTVLLPFDSAEIRPGVINGTYFLVVTGRAPCINMEVKLSPRMYVKCPEYWGIDLTGSLESGICLKAIKDFTITIDISSTIGSKGIEVVGAAGNKKIDQSGGCKGIDLY